MTVLTFEGYQNKHQIFIMKLTRNEIFILQSYFVGRKLIKKIHFCRIRLNVRLANMMQNQM